MKTYARACLVIVLLFPVVLNATERPQNECKSVLLSLGLKSQAAQDFLAFIKKLTEQGKISVADIETLMDSTSPRSPSLDQLHPLERLAYSKAIQKILKKMNEEDWDLIRAKLKDLKSDLDSAQKVEGQNRQNTQEIIYPKLIAKEPAFHRVKHLHDVSSPDGSFRLSYFVQAAMLGRDNFLMIFENSPWKVAGTIRIPPLFKNIRSGGVTALRYGDGKTAVFIRATYVGQGKAKRHDTVMGFDLATGALITPSLSIDNPDFKEFGWLDRIDTVQPYELDGKFYALVHDGIGFKIIDFEDKKTRAFAWASSGSQALLRSLAIKDSKIEISNVFLFNGRPSFAVDLFFDRIEGANPEPAKDFLAVIDGVTGEIKLINPFDVDQSLHKWPTPWYSNPTVFHDPAGKPLIFVKFTQIVSHSSYVYVQDLLTGESRGGFTFNGKLIKEIEFQKSEGRYYGIAVTEKEILVFYPETGAVLVRFHHGTGAEKAFYEPREGSLGRIHLYTDETHFTYDLMGAGGGT